MQSIGVHFERGGHHGLDVEITASGLRRADADRAIRKARRHRVEIRFRGREHRVDAELATGTDDARRDLAAIGNEDAPQRHFSASRISTRCASTSSPFAAQISITVPCAPAYTEFISFMVSTIPTTVSGPTRDPTSTNGSAPGLGAR